MRFDIPDRPASRRSAPFVLALALACAAASAARAQAVRDTVHAPTGGTVAPTTPADTTDVNQPGSASKYGQAPVRLGPLPPSAPSYSAKDTTFRPVGVLRSGDVLKIAVYRNKELSADYLIDSQGFVQIPGLGTIRAAGLDPSQIKQQLVQALVDRGFADPDVAVQPLVRISVLGEVRQPGLYPVDPGTSLIQLLTIAGGPSEKADLRKTTVVREGRAFPVDLASALSGSASGRIVLYSNDVVVIPAKSGLTRENFEFGLSLVSAALVIVNVLVTLKK